MMDVNKMMNMLNDMLPQLEQIDKRVERMYENGEWYDLTEEERYIYLQLRDMQYNHISRLVADIKYTGREVKAEGRLVRNELGRYEMEGYGQFTSGEAIELYIEDSHREGVYNWISGRIEHNSRYGGYYFTGEPQAILDGVLARVK